jgi:hypothetical protein
MKNPITFIHRANTQDLINFWIGQNGYGVEVDVRTRNGRIWVGHDKPEWQFDLRLADRFPTKFLFHAKDIESFKFLQIGMMYPKLHVFYQNEDDVSLSSFGKYVLHSRVTLDRPYTYEEIPVLPCKDYSTAYGAVVEDSDPW